MKLNDKLFLNFSCYTFGKCPPLLQRGMTNHKKDLNKELMGKIVLSNLKINLS